MRPCLALTLSTSALVAATSAASETSTSIPGSAAFAASAERSLEPVTITVAPSDWKSLAVSAPMPLVPPVMRAILPSSLAMKELLTSMDCRAAEMGRRGEQAMVPAAERPGRGSNAIRQTEGR